MRIAKNILYLIGVLFMFSCSMETYSTKKAYADSEIQLYVEENEYNTKADTMGLVYIPMEKGNGEYPQKGNIVAFHYVGYYLDGEIFDSSYDRKYPLIVELGNNQIIKGLEYAILKMDKGAKAKVIIPFYLAYDEISNAPVPPYSNLIFDIELIDIETNEIDSN